ncbi:MAG: hypothetical protein IJH04_08525 [Eggerthellaceae bacterium]|nr:hypothetical protein [Eggerthellaceae bacterium]
MKIERVDHLHVSAPDFDKFVDEFKKIMGREFTAPDMDMQHYGTIVTYEPYPIGIELFKAYDAERSVSSRLAASSRGVFAVSYKVPDIQEARKELEELGYKEIEYYDFGPIKEALYDTDDKFGFNLELIEYAGEDIQEVADPDVTEELLG